MGRLLRRAVVRVGEGEDEEWEERLCEVVVLRMEERSEEREGIGGGGCPDGVGGGGGAARLGV